MEDELIGVWKEGEKNMAAWVIIRIKKSEIEADILSVSETVLWGLNPSLMKFAFLLFLSIFKITLIHHPNKARSQGESSIMSHISFSLDFYCLESVHRLYYNRN